MKTISHYQIEDSLKDKCWRLSSYILAEYDFKELMHPLGEHWCIFENSYAESFEKTFIKELIELAGLTRALLDVYSVKIPKDIGGSTLNVGLLHEKNNPPKELIYREACNKLIHSNCYSIKLNKSKLHPLFNGKNGYEKCKKQSFKNPYIITEGSYNNKKWKAEINFLKFIEQTLSLPIY